MQRGYLRNKIGNKIAERRNRRRISEDDKDESLYSSSTPATTTTTTTMGSFNQLQRMESGDGGFLMVNDGRASDSRGGGGGASESRGDGGGEEDGSGGHVELNQDKGGGGEDEFFSDEELEDLDIPDDDDDEPCPKKSGSGTSESTSGSGMSESVKPWMSASKEVYEEQLLLLNEQLTNALLEKQTLHNENVNLNRQVEELRRSSSNSGGGAGGGASPKLELASNSGLRERGGGSYGGNTLTVTSEDGFEAVRMSPDVRASRLRSQKASQKKSYTMVIMEWVYEFIADFTEEQSSPNDQDEENPLSAKKLKNNLQRLSRTSKPWRDMGLFLQGILQWENTAESLVIFLIYMYCVWHGWIITMALFLSVLILTLTYLRTSGLAEQFGFQPRGATTEYVDDLGFANKLQLVKQVGQTCQNKAELVSDSLEKAQNLFLWYQPAATKFVYMRLCVVFVLSIFLPNSYLMTAIGLFVGFKLFIIDNIYRKYPKVKERHDSVAKIWKSLPTDTELIKRQAMTEEQLTLATSAAAVTDEDGHVVSRLSEDEMAFCTRFQVSPEELPLPTWETGKRCSIMNRDKPLSLTRSGRLYLSHSRLCFERSNRLQQRDSERFTLPLKEIAHITRAKPFAVLPGSGMSIEVTLVTGEKYLFSAILNRDQAYQSILDQGLILGLPWGTDIERRNRRGSSSSATNRSKSESASTEEREGSSKVD